MAEFSPETDAYLRELQAVIFQTSDCNTALRAAQDETRAEWRQERARVRREAYGRADYATILAREYDVIDGRIERRVGPLREAAEQHGDQVLAMMFGALHFPELAAQVRRILSPDEAARLNL
jgi:hypothetical protein